MANISSITTARTVYSTGSVPPDSIEYTHFYLKTHTQSHTVRKASAFPQIACAIYDGRRPKVRDIVAPPAPSPPSLYLVISKPGQTPTTRPRLHAMLKVHAHDSSPPSHILSVLYRPMDAIRGVVNVRIAKSRLDSEPSHFG